VNDRTHIGVTSLQRFHNPRQQKCVLPSAVWWGPLPKQSALMAVICQYLLLLSSGKVTGNPVDLMYRTYTNHELKQSAYSFGQKDDGVTAWQGLTLCLKRSKFELWSQSAKGLCLQSPSEMTCSAIASLQIINLSPAHLLLLNAGGSSSSKVKISQTAFLSPQ